MKKIVLSAFVLAGLMFTSCDKSDDETSGNNEVVPVKMSSEDSNMELSYDDQNRLVKLSDTSEGTHGQMTYSYSSVSELEYSGEELTKITEVYNSIYNENQTSSTTEYTFSKSNNTITVYYKMVDDGSTYTGSESLQIDEKGYLITNEDYLYFYNSKGNIVKISDEDTESLFEYDDKNGIFKNVKTPQWVLEHFFDIGVFFINNPVKYTYKDVEYPEDNETVSINYQYNASGYPIKMNAPEQTSTIQYNK